MLSAHGQAVLWRQCEAGGWWAGGWWAQGRRTVGSAGLAWVGAVSRCLVSFGVVQKRTPCDHPAMAPMGGLLSFFLPAAVRPHPCTGAAVSSTGLDNRRGICRGRVAVGLHAGLTGAQPVIRKRAASGEACATWLLRSTQTRHRPRVVVGNELRDRRASTAPFLYLSESGHLITNGGRTDTRHDR